MSKEMRKQIDRVKNWKQFVNETIYYHIDKFVFTLKDIPIENLLDINFSVKDFLEKIENDFEKFRNIYKDCYQSNIDNELLFFENPIIKEYQKII